MDMAFQVLIVIFSLSYKYFLAQRHLLGWVLAMVTAGLSFVYLIWFKYVPVLACLEFSFCLLNAYGLYKHMKRREALNFLDVITIVFTLIAIAFIAVAQIQAKTIWYEVVSSIAFLSGVVFLAQKKMSLKITGWLLYVVGCLTYAVVVYNKGAYGLVFVNIVSTFLCMYGIWKEVKKNRLNVSTARFT